MTRFRSDVEFAQVLYGLERDMVGLVRDGQFTEVEIRSLFSGWLHRLEITPAAIFLPAEPDAQFKLERRERG